MTGAWTGHRGSVSGDAALPFADTIPSQPGAFDALGTRTARGSGGAAAPRPERSRATRRTAPTTFQRSEVCPPSLLDEGSARSGLRSWLPTWSGMRDWLQTGWARAEVDTDDAARCDGDANARRFDAARGAIYRLLADIPSPAVDTLSGRVRRARSLRELWYLRNELFTLLAIHHCESIALRRVGELDDYFPTRIRRGIGTGTAAPGRPGGASTARDHALRA
jgi:hypothetical protein